MHNKHNQHEQHNQHVGNNHNHNHNNHEAHNNHENHHGHDNHNKHEKKIKCPAEIRENIDFTVPFEAHAHSRVGEIELQCGSSSVTHDGGSGGSKHFELKKRISAKIPVEFLAEVKVGKGSVEFDS